MMLMPAWATKKDTYCERNACAAQMTCAGQEMGAPTRVRTTAVCQSAQDKRLFSFTPFYNSQIQYDEVMNAF